VSARDEAKAEAFRALVRRLLADGKSVAAIAKLTGKSYVHTKRIADQEVTP